MKKQASMATPADTTNHLPAPGDRPPDHPLAAIFPMMDDGATAELAQDIKTNGLREKILLLDGQILDGRNRFAACLRVKVEPQWEFFDHRRHGESALGYVLSKNLKRRHLTPSQRAAVAAEALPLFEAEAKKRQKAAGTAGKANLKHQAPAAPAPAKPKGGMKPAPLPSKPGVIPGTSVRAFSAGVGDTPTPPKKAKPAAPAPAAAAPSTPPPAAKPEVVTLVMQARATLPVLKESLEKGKHPNGKKVTAPERQKLEEQIEACQQVLDAHPEEVKAQIERMKRIDTPPAAEPAAEKARDAAGAALGVSGRSVQSAKNLLEHAPKLAAEVKAGTKSLNAATKEAKMDSPEVVQALGRIAQVAGKSLAEAAREGTRLKSAKEILAYAGENDENMLKIRGLINQGWTVKEALKYKLKSIGRTHKVSDLLDRAAASDGMFTLEIDGWIVSVTRAKAA